MRFAALLLCIPLLAQEPAATARIEGRVIDGDGKAVAKATVTTGLLSDRQPRTTRTADDGTFVFEELTPAANYALTAQKAGYLPADLGAGAVRNAPPAPFSLAAGETARVELRLIAGGVITGTITNQSADPLAQATVVLWQVRYRLGVVDKNYVRIARTDDRGVYRFAALPAGRYVIVAGETGAGTAREGEANLTTYFRGTQQFEDATPVDVTPGGEVQADVTLFRGSVYSMRGKVTDASGAPMRQARVSVRRNNDAAFTTPAVAPTDDDGNFVVNSLIPGAYIVEPDAMFDPKTGVPVPRLAMSTRVTVGGADVDDVVLRPSSTASLKGTVRVQDGEWSAPKEQRREGPELSEQMLTSPAGVYRAAPFAGIAAMGSPVNGSYASALRPDATFEITGIVPGEYRFIAGGFPETYYVKAVLIGDRDITHVPVRVPSDSLTVVVSTKGAEIAGTLSRDGLSVALWPETDNPGHPLHGIRVVNSSKGGAFVLRGLAPGTYRIAAFDTSEAGALWNYALLNKFAKEAARVELGEGAKKNAEPPLIPTNRFNEELNKAQ